MFTLNKLSIFEYQDEQIGTITVGGQYAVQ